MRTLLITFMLFAALAVAGLALASSITRTPAAHKPVVRLVGNDIQGRAFYRHEVVRLKFTGPFELQRRVRTTAIGAFSATLPKYDPCTGPLIITASGMRGDEASLKLPPRACAPA
jgi:hypothetical protein